MYRDETGYYIADIDPKTAPYYAGHHTFYRLEDLIPRDDPKFPEDEDYVGSESHWLAIWDSKIAGAPFALEPGDLVRFRVEKVYGLTEFGHCAGPVRDIRVGNDITVIGKLKQ